MNISVLGSGAFGTALAMSLSGNAPVTLWSRSKDQAQKMQCARENVPRLPGYNLPETVTISSDFGAAAAADILLLAVPMQRLRSVCSTYREALAGKTLVACCKGIELGSHNGPIRILQDEIPGATPALLTGPSFARDIAQGLPTALALACQDRVRGKALQTALTTSNLRLYTTTDTVGAELGGALKNVMAIACGAVIGAGLGESARAALMTRGFAEMQRLAAKLGADPRTLAGLSGFGDLALTCTSNQSRNYQLGLALGAGSDSRPDATIEGVATAQSVADLAQRDGLDLPVTKTVADLVAGDLAINDAVRALLSRPLKDE